MERDPRDVNWSLVVCKLLGHRWHVQRGTEGERFKRCERCGSVTDAERHRMYPG
jgi:hypothetical protein